MSPDWTNVKSVRTWLDRRYLVGNHEIGSPFFQYLKDELVQGNKIKGREIYLSTHELFRWLFDTQPTRAFHYPAGAGAMHTPYYPEYIDQSSPSRSQSPIQSDDRTKHEAPNASNRNIPAERKSKQSKKRATTNPQKTKPARSTKQARSKTLLSAGDSKPAGTTKGGKRFDPETLRKQKARVNTLRPRSSCKRGDTDFFHPDNNPRRQKIP